MVVASPPPRSNLAAIATEALTGLTPVVVVNRRLDVALAQVDGAADRPFTTLHSDPRTDVHTSVRRLVRSVNERVRDTYGDGDAAGHTAYGSVRFVPTEDARAGAESVVDALRRQGDPGVRAFGPVSFVVDPDATDGRVSFAADDTGGTLAPVRTAAELANVVAERLERSQGESELAPDIARLATLPPAAARDAVRGWLLSDDLGRSDGYIEAQIRRLAPRDVLAAVVDTRDMQDVERRFAIDPGAAPAPRDVEQLDRQLTRLGIPARVVGAGDRQG
jgi:hypothetical protein